MNEYDSPRDAVEISGSPDSSMESASDSEFDKLIGLQTRKSELMKERDLLLRKKLDLQEDIRRLSERLASHNQQKLQFVAKKKLEFYLHQNDHENSRLSALDQAASFILDNLNVFSSSDWSARRKLIGKFYPHVSISKYNNLIIFEKGLKSNSIEFVLEGYGMPLFEISVRVSDEVVTDLIITNWSSVSFLLHEICPTYQETLDQFYIRHRKLDLLFYSYHCLSRVQYQKIGTFWKIVHQYPTFARSSSEAAKMDIEFLKNLMCQRFIDMTIESSGRSFLIRLEWTPMLPDSSSGEIESDIRFIILSSQSRISINTTEVFLRLVREYGVSKAFNLMLFNLFDIDVEL